MKTRWRLLRRLMVVVLLVLLVGGPAAVGQSAAAVAGFDAYAAKVEARLAVQHRTAEGFIAATPAVRPGEPLLEEMTCAGGMELPGALVHHLRGTAFVPGATAAGFEQMLRDFGSYPRVFAPQVLRAKVLWSAGDRMHGAMRVSQRHGITVVMDSTYDVEFGRLDPAHGYSRSRSIAMAEIEGAGTAKERVLSADEAHGFLWRQATYWSYAERDGGLEVQVESVSLSRGIPVGLGWVVRPFVETVPRTSLEFTLRAVGAALRR